MGLVPGDHIGHYRILELISINLGAVYKAYDEKRERIVALKVMRLEAVDEEHRRRFLRNAHTAAVIEHRYLASTYDAGEVGGMLYIVMEFLQGGTLQELLRNGPLEIQEAQRYAAEIAEGLARVHEAGFLHGDIKPANVVITMDRHVKIMGGSWWFHEPEGTFTGTPAYMSPEHIRGDVIDRRSEIFSLGVILYEMVTGKRPFSADTLAALTNSILRENPASASSINAMVSRRLDRIIERCLLKDPERRYTTAQQLAMELQTASGNPRG